MFLTLVLLNTKANAKPRQDINPVLNSNEIQNSEVSKKVDLDNQNLNVSKPSTKPSINSSQNYHYPFIQSVSPRIGTLIVTETFSEDIGNSFKMLYGFNYMLPQNISPQFEVGADIIKGFNGQIHAGKRWIINERTSFRPFYKLGVTVAAVGREGLATFANFENYMARASIGFEDYYKKPMSFRWELEVALGTENLFLYLTFGYSWGF